MVEKIETNSNVVVDSETGEILESTTSTSHSMQFFKKCKEDEFIMVYLHDLSGFLNIDNGTQIKLLSIIWREVHYNNPDLNDGNVLAILIDDKKRWADALHVTVRTIDNALSALVKKGLLLSDARSKYRLNPKYYFKGTSKDRQRILNLSVTYDITNENSDDLSNGIK